MEFSDESAAVIASLSEKQSEAMDLAMRGFTSKEAARELGISPWSVDARIDAVRAKLGGVSRGQAVRIYHQYAYTGKTGYDPIAIPPQAESDLAGPRSPGVEGVSPTRWLTELKPSDFGPWARLGLILAGALGLAIVILLGLGIAAGLKDILGA